MLALISGRDKLIEYATASLDILLKRKARYRAESSFEIALAYIGLHQFDTAVSWLTKAAFEEDNPMAMWFHIFPPLRHLRGHRGFEELLARLNLRSRRALRAPIFQRLQFSQRRGDF
jgi:hypothetical protein